jgi:hypothetical protein
LSVRLSACNSRTERFSKSLIFIIVRALKFWLNLDKSKRRFTLLPMCFSARI